MSNEKGHFADNYFRQQLLNRPLTLIFNSLICKWFEYFGNYVHREIGLVSDVVSLYLT